MATKPPRTFPILSWDRRESRPTLKERQSLGATSSPEPLHSGSAWGGLRRWSSRTPRRPQRHYKAIKWLTAEHALVRATVDLQQTSSPESYAQREKVTTLTRLRMTDTIYKLKYLSLFSETERIPSTSTRLGYRRDTIALCI